VGFANVSESLDELYQDQAEQNQLELEQARLLTSKPHGFKKNSSSRRWRITSQWQ